VKEEGIIVKSTHDQITEFKESLLWDDIKNELAAWKIGFEYELQTITENVATENSSTAAVLMHIGDINGRIKAVNYMISLPDIFLQILEDRKDDSKHK